LNHIQMTMICGDCEEGECDGESCALKRNIKEADPDAIMEGGES